MINNGKFPIIFLPSCQIFQAFTCSLSACGRAARWTQALELMKLAQRRGRRFPREIFTRENGWICNMDGFSGQKREICFFFNAFWTWGSFGVVSLPFLIGKSCYFLGKTLDFRWLMIFEDLRWFRRLSELDKYRTTEHDGKTCVFCHLFQQFSASFHSKPWTFTV